MRLCWRDIRPSFLKYNPKSTAIPEIIPVVLICTAGIILAGQMHPQLALLLHRDYFRQPDSSLSCFFVPQGLLCPGRMHLYLLLLLHRDYFRRPDSSLSRAFAPQGLFPPSKCISVSLFCSTGITSAGQMHLYLALLLHRDYFAPAGCISILLFCSTRIISAGQMHLYLALLSRLLDFLLFLSRSPAQTSIAPMIP